MKSILQLCLILLLLQADSLYAQSITNYSFNSGSNASLLRTDGSLIDDIDMSIGSTILLGGSQSNTQSNTLQPIGFDFFLNGTRHQQFNVTSNGNIGLSSFATPGFGWLGVNATRIAPFLGSTTTTMGTSSIGRIHYKTIGTAPSRVCVIEFLRMAINSSVLDDTTTFQVRLYENNGEIEFVYGRMAVTTGAPLSFNVGFHTSTTIYQSVNINSHSASTSTSTLNTLNSNGYINQLHSNTNGNRRYYRWIPTPPDDPTNFAVSSVTNNSATLTWNDALDEISYVLYRSVDGINYAFQSIIAANSTTITQAGLSPNTTYYWRLASIKESIGSMQDASATTLAPNKIISSGSGNWTNNATWVGGNVPTISDSVEIAAGHTVTIDNSGGAAVLEVTGTLQYPNFGNPTLSINSDLIIKSTGVFNSGNGNSNGILNIGNTASNNISANLIVNGTFDMANNNALVTTNFLGLQNASITGSGSTCDFGFLNVNKGTSNTPILDVLRVITLQTPTNGNSRLTMNSGTCKISSATNITPYLGTSANINPIAINGRLWLANASANIGTTTGAPGGGANWQLQGEIRIDNGTLTIGSGSHQGFFGANSVIRLDGGNLNINGSLVLQNNVNCSLVMNGGNLNIDPQASGNLNNFTTIFSVPAAATLIWNSGNITIIDPHNTASGTAVAIASGGNKVFNGGKLILGDGVSTSGSGGGNTSGFGLNITVPIHNIEINNRTNASPSRMVRLQADLAVTGLLELKPNSYLFLGSATAGATCSTTGTSLVNDGTIAGSEPGGSQVVGTLLFNGTSGLQTLSGAGNSYNANVLSINNSGTGVTFSNTAGLSFARVNLQRGLFNRGTNFTIGFTGNPGVVQIGGIDEFTPAGSFNAVPTYSGSPSFIYGPTSSTCTIGTFNEVATGSLTAATITVNDAEGLTANRNISATNLVLNGGNLIMGVNNLTIGASAANPGSLTRNSGFVNLSTGIFTRWYGTTAITSGYASGFPVISSNDERSVFVATNGALTTGGTISVQHSRVLGNTDFTAFTDGGVNISRRSNSSWTLSSSGIDIGTSNLTVTLRAQGIGAVTDVTGLRMIRSNNGTNGTWLAGSGTNLLPEVNRQFSQANIASSQLNDTYYFGTDPAINPISPVVIAIANGSWGDASTWDINAVPTVSNSVIIPNGYSVSIPTGSAFACNDLTISSGGSLTANNNVLNISGSLSLNGALNIGGGSVNITGIANGGLTVAATTGTLAITSGNLTIGASGGSNRTLNLLGILNISGGVLNINGNFIVANSSSFSQTGGNINIDGNSGTAATSVPSGTHLVSINTNNVNCSAGILTIIDPPHSSYAATSTHSLRITASASTSCFSGTHTIRLGDGVSAESGNISGFCLDTKRSGVVPIRNLVVNGGNVSGRWASTSFSTGSFGLHVTGSLTINSGSEFRHISNCQLALGGNIINNGTMTSAWPLTLGGIGYIVTNAQDISGVGLFRNNTTASTGAFTSVSLANGTGLTLSTLNQNFVFTSTLSIAALNILGNTNTVTISSTGTLSRTTGYIAGKLGLNYTTGSNISKTFDVGSSSNYLPVTITFPVVSAAGIFTVGVNTGDHPQIASSCIDANKTINRNWSFNSTLLPTNYNVTLSYLSSDSDPAFSSTNARLQINNGTSWNGASTGTVGATSANFSNLNSIGDIQMGEFNPVTVGISIAASSSIICPGTNVTFTATPSNGGSSPVYQWKKNGSNVGTNSTTYSDNTINNNDQITCTITSSLVCAVIPSVVSNIITMTVTPQTVAGSISGGGSPICSGSSGPSLSLAGNTGNVLRWQSSTSPFTSWNNISNTTTSLLTGTLTQSTAFRAVVQNGACNILNTDSVSVLVTPATAGGSVSGGTSICTGSTSGTLTLSGNTGNVVRWESAVAPFTTWTSISNTTTTHTSGALTQTTQFRAVVQSGTCPEANSSTTTVTVTPATAGGSVSGGTTICSGATSGTLTLSGNTGNVVRWESSVAPFTTWTSISNTTTTHTSGALTQTT
ncbi:MAG: hypothetical protein ACK5FU_04065, partial [Bacteroidota bacterium]